MQSTDRHGYSSMYKQTDTEGVNETHIIRVHTRQANPPVHLPDRASINLTSDTSQMDDGRSELSLTIICSTIIIIS